MQWRLAARGLLCIKCESTSTASPRRLYIMSDYAELTSLLSILTKSGKLLFFKKKKKRHPTLPEGQHWIKSIRRTGSGSKFTLRSLEYKRLSVNSSHLPRVLPGCGWEACVPPSPSGDAPLAGSTMPGRFQGRGQIKVSTWSSLSYTCITL